MSSKLVVQVEPERLELRLRGVSALAAGTVYAPVVLEGAGGAVAPVLRLFRDETCADAVAWTSEPASPVPHHSRLHSFPELRLDVQAALDWFSDARDAKTLPQSSRVCGWLVAVDMGEPGVEGGAGPRVLGASRVPVLLHDFSPVPQEPGDSWSTVLAELVAEAIAGSPMDATLGTRVSALETGKQDVISDLAAIRSGAAAGAAALQDVPTATETLAAEEYSSPDNSVTVDTPNQRDVKLKIRNPLSNTVNTLDTSAGGTIATREWVQQEIDVPSPSDADPAANGTAWEGESNDYSRADHVHPTDTSRQASITASGILKGNGSGGVSAATAGTDYQAPLSAYTSNPAMDGTAAAGTSSAYAKGDHVHPTDTSRQAKITASGMLKGNGSGTISAAVAGTDYQAPLSAYTSNPAMDGTASAGSSSAYSKGDHVHPTDTSRQAKITASGLLKGNGSGTISAAVAGTDYQAPLTIDETPTASSTNPVQSGGVKTALDGKLDSSVTDAYSIAVASGHLTVTDSQSGAAYTFAGPVSNPDDVARGEDLPYVTGVVMDESEGVYCPFDRAVNSYEATDGDTTLTLDMPQPMPVDQGGRARDFIVDVDNSANTGALGIEFNLLGEDYALAVADGDDLAEITELAAGERARFYFTETVQRYTPSGAQDSIPVISIQRMTIEVVTSQGGA